MRRDKPWGRELFRLGRQEYPAFGWTYGFPDLSTQTLLTSESKPLWRWPNLSKSWLVLVPEYLSN